jgi:plastocyanin
MSILGKRIPLKVIGAMVGIMLLAALLPALSNTPSREIALVVRGMAFYLENDPLTPNPTLDIKAGERVRVVVRNEDRGVFHNFAVPAAKAALDPVRWNESDDVVFKAPKTRGVYEYECRPHRLMMRGTIRVY